MPTPRSPRRLAPRAALVALAFALAVLVPGARADEMRQIKLPCLSGAVEVVFDRFAVPHIYAKSADDAYRALGYLHARDRMLQMEMMRRQANGTLSEVIGKDGLESDILMRKLGIRKNSEDAIKSGLLGKEVVQALEAYAEGVNARFAEVGDNGKPPMLKFMGVKLPPWTPADSVAFLKYMGWDQGGTDSDLWMGMMVDALGAETVDELWPLDRPYEKPTVPTWPSNLPEPAKGEIPHAQVAPSGPSEDMLALASLGPIGKDVYKDAIRRVMAASSPRDTWTIGSNNWAISGAKSTTGKPILCNDPHLGLHIPSVWYTAHLVAPGLNVIGITFPVCPFVIIGHTDRASWGITNMQADAVDYFVETLNPENPKQYKHKGQWKTLEERKETIDVRGEAPHELLIESTVHGPIDREKNRVLAIEWAGNRVTLETRAIAALNRCENLDDFRRALRFQGVPALNMLFADADGDIAIAPQGDLPLRARGKGRVPVDGASGDYDWLGFIPGSELPISVNPERGWLASANGRPQPMGYPHYLGWMWDPSYRTRRIHDMLESKAKLSFEDMQRFQFDAHDKAAEVFVPVLVEAYDRAPYGEPVHKQAMEALRRWDYVCDPGRNAPTIYAKWLEVYRGMVWDDEWKTRGIEQPEGSWGFCGENRREPVFEYLEYITRSNPDSIWFDDRTTPERETRDDILKKSFLATIEWLQKNMGQDPQAWMWGNLNKLHLSPLVPSPQLARGGMPVVGGPFTVNPGGWMGDVGGGASWRQVVDLGDLGRSVGVYPGGQLDDPKSPHYDDQVELWAKGEYAPMIYNATAAEFKADQVEYRATMAR